MKFAANLSLKEHQFFFTHPVDVLSNEFEKRKSETTIVMNELVDVREIRNDQMRVNHHAAQENDSLKKRKQGFKIFDLQKLESLLTETSSKLSVAENEKASLVAVIRLLNEDCANVITLGKTIAVNRVNRKIHGARFIEEARIKSPVMP